VGGNVLPPINFLMPAAFDQQPAFSFFVETHKPALSAINGTIQPMPLTAYTFLA
jgi:hypothetical protein